MSIENWIQMSVPIVGIVLAVVSASLSYLYAKRSQLRADELRLKEKSYLDYIKALSNNVISDNQKEAKGKLSDAHNHILLIGSASVVTKLRKFSKFIAIDNYNSEHFTIDEHDRLLTDLIKAMRKDLYKGRSVNKDYPIVSLSGSKGKNK